MRARRAGAEVGWPWRPFAVMVVVIAVAAGCDVLSLGERRMFGTAFADDGDGTGLIVTVQDGTGRVVSLDVAEQLPGGQPMEASAVLMLHPVKPDAFIVGWLGGDCDIETTISVSPAEIGRVTVTMRTEVEANPCEDLGVERVAIITMDGPVDLSRIGLEVMGDG